MRRKNLPSLPTRQLFVSRPTKLATAYSAQAEKFELFLKGHGFDPVRLGGSSYSTKAPLHAVIDLMTTCVGAIVLGYPKQAIAIEGFGTDISFELPTPWNHIEGALAYALKKPALVVAHHTIGGGVFDKGITGEFVYRGDLSKAGWFKTGAFLGVFDDWKQRV